MLGVARGNGLEQIGCGATNRIVAFDINARYLDEIRRRFGSLTDPKPQKELESKLYIARKSRHLSVPTCSKDHASR
jgi:hypothetical protein